MRARSSGTDSSPGGEASTLCDWPTLDVSPSAACSIAQAMDDAGASAGLACDQTCGDTFHTCFLGSSYAMQFDALNADGGLHTVCPPDAGDVAVTCQPPLSCIGGRRTEGFAVREERAASDGERLAAMAWLEAVSVHAFERLEREASRPRCPNPAAAPDTPGAPR